MVEEEPASQESDDNLTTAVTSESDHLLLHTCGRVRVQREGSLGEGESNDVSSADSGRLSPDNVCAPPRHCSCYILGKKGVLHLRGG